MTTYEEELYDWHENYHSDPTLPELEELEEAKEFISEALECLYGNKSLEHLEFTLQNACAYLDIPYPKGELKIKKKNQYFDFGVFLAKNQAKILNKIPEGE